MLRRVLLNGGRGAVASSWSSLRACEQKATCDGISLNFGGSAVDGCGASLHILVLPILPVCIARKRSPELGKMLPELAPVQLQHHLCRPCADTIRLHLGNTH